MVRHFDGRTSLDQIRLGIQAETGQSASMTDLETLVESLDRAMVLDGPSLARFVDQYARQAIRPSSHAGRSYPADGEALRQELTRSFQGPRGAGLPTNPPRVDSRPIRAILSPHIDFGRGGPVYTHAYKELIERSDADVFVILGVAHQYCKNRFALTRKDFQTPLGTARTDRAFVDRVAAIAGNHLFEDELAHRTEHSIEFQVVFLQYGLGRSPRFISIVPILVGSFHDLMQGRDRPDRPTRGRRRDGRGPPIGRGVESGKKVAYIGGIDLCHVGPEFGDPSTGRRRRPSIEQSGRFDQAMLDRASQRRRRPAGSRWPPRSRQPLASLRPGRDLHDARSHRPGPRSAPQL